MEAFNKFISITFCLDIQIKGIGMLTYIVKYRKNHIHIKTLIKTIKGFINIVKSNILRIQMYKRNNGLKISSCDVN